MGETIWNLRGCREAAGLKQREVADRMGRSVSWVSRLERSADPRISTVQRYLRACNCHLEIEITLGDVGSGPEAVERGPQPRGSASS